MKIETLRFGEIDIEEARIFDFVLPIIGFDKLKKFVILEPTKDNLFKWLQSVEDPTLAFPIISVSALDYDYTIDIADNVIDSCVKEPIDIIDTTTVIPIEIIFINAPKAPVSYHFKCV